MTDIRIWMHEVLNSTLHDALHPVEQDPEDDRVKISDATRARMAERGLQFPLPAGPLVVVMLDDIVNTAFVRSVSAIALQKRSNPSDDRAGVSPSATMRMK
jgi:hypothetical protein